LTGKRATIARNSWYVRAQSAALLLAHHRVHQPLVLPHQRVQTGAVSRLRLAE
jgi:hypothetical protein